MTEEEKIESKFWTWVDIKSSSQIVLKPLDLR